MIRGLLGKDKGGAQAALGREDRAAEERQDVLCASFIIL